jgi:mannose-6-phosphate isomerase
MAETMSGRGLAGQRELASRPVFFERNRVARVYRGGRLFHGFFGDPPEDGLQPEEWVASTVRALNRDPRSESEGLSRVAGTEVLFSRLVADFPRETLGLGPGEYGRSELGILVKLLDSAIRLPAQAHPTKEFAREHFHSPHGKTEMWLVLGTRPGACLYYGLKRGVGREELRRASRASEQDREALPRLLNRVPARVGDVYLIPAGVAHAIGPGCLILEVQEPTDFTIQPEAWCGDYHLSPYEMTLGLAEQTALDCFDYTDLVGRRALSAGRKRPRLLARGPGLRVEALIGAADTPDFAVNRIRLARSRTVLERAPAVHVVTAGAGAVRLGDYSRKLSRGDYFFLPAAARGAELAGEDRLEVVECLPPEMPSEADGASAAAGPAAGPTAR